MISKAKDQKYTNVHKEQHTAGNFSNNSRKKGEDPPAIE